MKTIKVTTQELLDKVLQLRKEVFVDEQGVDINLEHDDLDTLDNPLVEHFALTLYEDIVIGTARVIYIDDKIVRLGRFSIHPNLRHQGFGLKFLRVIENYYFRKKVESMIVHSQQHAISFYASAGFEPYGQLYDEAGIPHQNMHKRLYQQFYTRFAEVYDLIFPLGEIKQKMLSEFAQDKRSILDIGCGTGEAIKYLDQLNIETKGIDADQQMVFVAQSKNLDVIHLDMRQLNAIPQTFDGLLCLGNVLVHLDDIDEINDFLNDCHQLLNQNGQLLIQIINYHKILNQRITDLPTLISHNKRVSLKRHYHLDNKIKFTSTLKIGRKEFTSSLDLYPLLPSELMQVAEKNNFEIINTYGAFDFRAYDNNESDSFILLLQKKDTD